MQVRSRDTVALWAAAAVLLMAASTNTRAEEQVPPTERAPAAAQRPALPDPSARRLDSTPDREPAIKVHLPTLADHLSTLGGRHVHIPDVLIGEVLSPQAFTVESRMLLFRGPAHWTPSRGLVLLGAESARALVAGAEVQVWGRALTLTGAHVQVGWPPELTRDAIEAFRGVPVIMADVIRTQDGAALYERSGAASVTNDQYPIRTAQRTPKSTTSPAATRK